MAIIVLLTVTCGTCFGLCLLGLLSDYIVPWVADQRKRKAPTKAATSSECNTK